MGPNLVTNSPMVSGVPDVVVGTVNSGKGVSNRDYEGYWDDSNVVADWAMGIDTQGHNERIAEQSYNAREAEKQRAYEKMLSDTAFRRKVADYIAAGFSPLAALEGSAGASTPSGVAASSPGFSKGSNNFGSLLGAMVTAIALAVSKGVSAASATKAASAKEAADYEKAIRDMEYGFAKIKDQKEAAKELEAFKKLLGHKNYR